MSSLLSVGNGARTRKCCGLQVVPVVGALRLFSVSLELCGCLWHRGIARAKWLYIGSCNVVMCRGAHFGGFQQYSDVGVGQTIIP